MERLKGELLMKPLSKYAVITLLIGLCLACEYEEDKSRVEGGAGGGDDELTPTSALPDQGMDGMGRGERDADLPEGDCFPDQTQWEEVSPLMKTYCGMCHGETPQFGAPYSLATQSDFTAEHAKQAASQLSSGAMPPAGQPQLSSEERMSLLSWLSCGDVGDTPTEVPAGGVQSTKPILSAEGDIPEGVDFFEIRAGGYQVPERWTDRYECFTISAPVSEERFIRRIETIVDDARVLHHVVLIPEDGGREPNTHSKCDEDNPFALIYGWAPGQGALQFEQGGIRLSPGQSLTLQIHYNNRAQYDDAIDDSGVRIYHGPVEGQEVSVLTLGPVGFQIPPRTRKEVTGYCELPQDTRLIASFPHMHEVGAGFEQSVARDWLNLSEAAEVIWEDIITLSGWDFESQYVYDTPLNLSRGDLIKTTCLYENTSDEPVSFGEKTADEMCFNFAYVSPPVPISLCDQSEPPHRRFNAGVCAPDDAIDWSPPSTLIDFTTTPSDFTATPSEALPVGLYWIDEAVAILPADLVEQYRFDLEQSGARGRGFLKWGEGDQVWLDLNSEMRIVASGLSFTERLDLSLSGTVLTVASRGEEVNAFELSLHCGELSSELFWVHADELLAPETEPRGGWMTIPIEFGPIQLDVQLHVIRADH